MFFMEILPPISELKSSIKNLVIHLQKLFCCTSIRINPNQKKRNLSLMQESAKRIRPCIDRKEKPTNL